MAKTVKVEERTGSIQEPCIQCGKYNSGKIFSLAGTGFLGVTEAKWFCSAGCAYSYARDRGWTVK